MKKLKIETEKIESFEKTINHLQEQLTSQRIINETVTKKNLELESQIEELTTGQVGLEKRCRHKSRQLYLVNLLKI